MNCKKTPIKIRKATSVHHIGLQGSGDTCFTQLTFSNMWRKNLTPQSLENYPFSFNSLGENLHLTRLDSAVPTSHLANIVFSKNIQIPSIPQPKQKHPGEKGGRAINLASHNFTHNSLIDSGATPPPQKKTTKNFRRQKTLPKILLLLMMMFCCKGAPNLIPPVGNDHSIEWSVVGLVEMGVSTQIRWLKSWICI